MERDLRRHLPRHAECLDGLSRAAAVPRAWLVERLEPEPALASELGEDLGLALSGERTEGAALLLRGLPTPCFVRRARPAGGIDCLEIALPWWPGALAALSAAGLAGVLCRRSPAAADETCAAPAGLLLQDALHRSGSLSAAVEWCLRRPAGGAATLVLGDAEGAAVAIEYEGGRRRLLAPTTGLAFAAAPPELAIELAKSARPRTAAALLQAAGRPVAVLSPGARRLHCAPEGGPPQAFEL